MKIKSLELHGFKSFPDRTKINFDSGVTVIVGPNGSGKSNISDAIRWVLGELSSKNLRGTKMEDVVFGGTDSRSPMSFAEVSITFENTGDNTLNSEYETITVTRRYYRSSDSEYLINNKTVRLRDIVNLFMNTGIGKTGYSIVGQGRVSEIISLKSEDRRTIFEEAAGISKYRVQKQDAEKRLIETDSNLVRVTDILREHESRLPMLEKESAKAKIYLGLYDRKKELDVTLALYDVEKIALQSEETEKSYKIVKHDLEAAEETIASLDTRNEKLYQLQQESKMISETTKRELDEAVSSLHTLESRLLVGKNEMTHLDADISNYRQSIDEYQKSYKQYESKLEASKSKLALEDSKLLEFESIYNEKESSLIAIRENIAKCNAKISELEEQKIQTQDKLTESKISLSSISASNTSISLRQDELSEDKKSTLEALENLNAKLKDSQDELSDYKNSADELINERDILSSKIEDNNAKVKDLTEKINDTNLKIASCSQRAEALRKMEEHFDGYQKSTRFVANAAKNGILQGICGPVSHLISVERQFSLAIETALGAGLQNIVVEDEKAAKNAINYLFRENAGRATFYPISSIKPAFVSSDMKKAASFKGYAGIASELVSFDSKYHNVISYLLGKTLIFDNLDNATTFAKSCGYSVKLVTLDGQVINAGGSFTGGSAKRDSGILTRNSEISELLEANEKSSRLIKEYEKELLTYKEQANELNSDLADVSERINLLAALYRSEETTSKMLLSQIEEKNSELASIETAEKTLVRQDKEKQIEIASLNSLIEQLTISLSNCDNEISSMTLRHSRLSAELENAITDKNSSLVQISVQKKVVEGVQRDIENHSESLVSISAQIEQTNEKIRIFTQKYESLRSNIDEYEKSINSHNADISSANSKLSKIYEELSSFDKEMNDLRVKMREASHTRDLLYTEFTGLQAQCDRFTQEKEKITEKLWDEYELTYTSAMELGYPPITEDVRPKAVSEQNKLRSQIRNLGHINVASIEEYAEVKQKYDFLSTQVSDLEKSKKEFLKVIEQLEGEMKTRFLDVFNTVNDNFKEVFRELFGGGNANLSLTDPENVLSSGIEISVAPPGKIIKNLKLLSGGEQVFVAIAIIFAILRVNPSPFCLFDEIESALDEVNVDRFAEYAKRFSEKMQFIIITHRRGTMENADRLYGVTMQERGISRILTVDVGEVESRIGVKL